MKILFCLMLLLVPASGYPERRGIEEQMKYQGQAKKEVSKTARECKDSCGSSIAQKAAADAKAAAAAQNAAGAQAAHMIKTQLAEKALQAAKAAEAALAGKQAVVEQLQQEVKETEVVVAENTAAANQQKDSVNVALQAAQQVTTQHKLMQQAAQLAALSEKTVLNLLDNVKFSLDEKHRNLAEARARLANLQHQLQCACAACAATKQAAHCACEAARAACGNARKKKHVPNHITHKIRN